MYCQSATDFAPPVQRKAAFSRHIFAAFESYSSVLSDVSFGYTRNCSKMIGSWIS